MNIRVPQSGAAAKIAKSFLKEKGIDVSHSLALELVARLNGYADNQAMQADARFSEPLVLCAQASAVYNLRDSASRVFITLGNGMVRIQRSAEDISVAILGQDSLGVPSLSEAHLALTGANVQSPEALSEAIKARYLHSGRSRHDVQEALDSLRKHCSDIFENETDMWEFLMDESPEESKPAEDAYASTGSDDFFVPAPVDWAAVAEEEDLACLRFDKNPERPLIHVEATHLGLAHSRGTFEPYASFEALTYAVTESGQEIRVLLKTLAGAEEVEPGLIQLKDGRFLQLMRQEESGKYTVFSPALKRYL